MNLSSDPFGFQGTERFQVRGHLGSGSFGDVFRVYDRKLKTVVALKTLTRADPDAVHRFKTEFRALADVTHPNLVQLYELLSEDDQWFFTMELVDGLDFMEYVRQRPVAQLDGMTPVLPAAERLAVLPEDGDDGETTKQLSNRTVDPRLDFARIRRGFRQLAEGLSALHEAGKLHRDVKPSNIRVTGEGRVVLLDFGLVKELLSTETLQTMVSGILGTPAYMAPEQAVGQQLTAASDWYAAGVALFEALTGQWPFVGGALQILAAKQQRGAPSPLEVVSGLPPELSELCEDLLARDPAKRPSEGSPCSFTDSTSCRALSCRSTAPTLPGSARRAGGV